MGTLKLEDMLVGGKIVEKNFESVFPSFGENARNIAVGG
jgi:hypothetical protein